jgi:hypothetical protein
LFFILINKSWQKKEKKDKTKKKKAVKKGARGVKK